MRLQKHLIEATDGDVAENFWNVVQKKCKPFLREWLPIVERYPSKDWFLYRGMKLSVPMGEKSVRINRKPMNSKEEFHKDVDDAMYKRFKIHGRKASIFCVGDEKEAESYGNPYVIFPIGSYKYLWSPKIRDLFANKEMFDYVTFRYTGDPKTYDIRQSELRERNKTAIDNMVKTYKTTGLEDAISSKFEVMVQCSSYMFLSASYSSYLQDVIDGMFE